MWSPHLLERAFPSIVDYFAPGQFPQEAIKKQCMLMPTKKCSGTRCQGWKWRRRRYNWRGLFVKRRGGCKL